MSLTLVVGETSQEDGLDMRHAKLENEFTEEEEDIVWSLVNYLYNDRPAPKDQMLVEWVSKYGRFHDSKVVSELLRGRRGDVYKALYAYNSSAKESLEVLKKRLEEIAISGHNHGN